MQSRILATTFTLTIALSGCNPIAHQASTQKPLTNSDGTVSPDDTGMVQVINAAGACTGTLVRNDWVLTAQHCVAGGFDQVSSYVIKMGAQSAGVLQAVPVMDDDGTIRTDIDAMLLQLDHPLTMQGSAHDFQRALSDDTAQQITQNVPIGCWGYGLSGGQATAPDGQLRLTVDARITGVFDNKLIVSSDQSHFADGDSGGPCLSSDGRIAGIIMGWGGPHLSLQLLTPAYRLSPWLDEVIAAYGTQTCSPFECFDGSQCTFTNVISDVANCGTCGNVCGPGATCSDGKCSDGTGGGGSGSGCAGSLPPGCTCTPSGWRCAGTT